MKKKYPTAFKCDKRWYFNIVSFNSVILIALVRSFTTMLSNVFKVHLHRVEVDTSWIQPIL